MLPSMNPRILVLGLDTDADYLRTYTDAVRDGGAFGPFQITARAADGVPEAMEIGDHPFLIAVQWHPENLVYGNAAARGLFQGFIEAARGRAGS